MDTSPKPKTLPQTKRAPKKGHGHCFSRLLSVWSTTFFWIPAKPLHLRSMLSKSMKCTKNCNTCSHYLSTEWTQFFSTMPDCKSHNQCSKSWTNWATKFCLICHIYLISHQPTTTSSSISTTICQENNSTTSTTQKMLSKSSSNPETCIFMLQEQTNSFLIGKDVLTVMVPILINKDVFELHYNDLKFTVCIHQGNQIWKRHVHPNVHRSTVYNSQTWKQPRCPSADKWIRKLWYIYTMEDYLAIKKNSFESVLMRWIKLEPIIQSEVSQKDKHQYSILTHIYGI